MKNPITEARMKLNMNTQEFALMAGVSDNTIRYHDRGDNMKISPPLLKFLTDELGYDRDQLIKDYTKFREAKKKRLLQSIKK